MASSQKTVVMALMSALAAVLFVPSAFAVAAAAPDPVVVWDGAASEFNFSNLTRTKDDNTYTLNLHANTTDANCSYILIGSENAKAGVTITATNTDPAVTNAFGESGAVSVIMKCSNLNLTDSIYRCVIGLLADGGEFYSGDNNMKVGLATGYNSGSYSFFFKNGQLNTYANNTTSFSIGAASQTICLTYNAGSGAKVYLNGELIASAAVTFEDWLTPTGITLGGVDKDGSTRCDTQTGLKIEAVAVFASELSESEVADYRFPWDELLNVTADTTVSAINSQFGTDSEINLYVEKGVTITGDASFNASKVNFHCAGSFTLTPPAGNTAVFDFSDVKGRPVIEYSSLPTVSGSVFTSTTVPEFVTDSSQWSGVIYIAGGSFTDFTSNTFGNEFSVVRLGTVSGWFRAPGNYAFTNTVPVELVGTLTIDNGNSANDGSPNRCTVFKKFSGNGGIYADATANKVVVVIQDASEFTGGIGLNGGKVIVFGETMPAYERISGATIFVMEGTSVTAGGFWWATGAKVFVDGELRASGLEKFGGGTYITTSDTGKFTLTNAGAVDDSATDYARITGTGTLRYEGTGELRILSNVNFPTNMITEVELAGSRGGLGLSAPSANYTHTIGSLSGSKRIFTDFNLVNGNRNLRILQAKDTTYSGVFDGGRDGDLIGTVFVSPGVSSSGTLTLSGVQTQSNDLVVETNATVNLTGTWVGPVNVDGTISGTGTVDGNLTLNDGATLKVDDLSGALAVSGAFTATGAISIELPEGALSSSRRKCMLLSSTGSVDLSGATFTLTVGDEPVNMADYGFSVFRGRLMLKRNGSVYTIR